MKPKYTIRKLLLVIAIISVLLAVVVPASKYVISQYTDTLSPSMNFVWLNGGWIQTDGDLKSVTLAGIRIRNEDLAHVRRINPYFEIDLSDTPIDDYGLPLLYGVRANRIKLTNTNVTADGIKELKSNCESTCLVLWSGESMIK